MDKVSKRKSEEDEEIVAIREQRRRLKQQIDRQRQSREQLLNSLSSLVPDITSSLELTVKLWSAFDGFDRQRPLKNQKLLNFGSREANGVLQHVSNGKAEAALRAVNGTRSEDDGFSGRGAHEIVKGIVVSCLMSSNVTAPIDSAGVCRRLPKEFSLAERDAIAEVGADGGVVTAVEAVLKALADGPGAALEIEECVLGGKTRVMVLMIDKARLSKELSGHFGMGKDGSPGAGAGPHSDVWPGNTDLHMQGPLAVPGPPMYPRMMGPRPRIGMMGMPGVPGMGMGFGGMPPFQRPPLGPGPLPGPGASTRGKSSDDDVMKDLEALLNKKSYRELQKSKTGEELLDLLHRPTAKETAVAAKFKTKGGSALKEYCPDLTKEDCRCHRGSYLACEKMHFRRIIAPHTDVNLGDCSFLDTCRHMKTCKYVHYELDPTPDVPGMILGVPPLQKTISKRRAEYCSEVELGEPQWVNCDIRSFKMEILGQFGVIMADPPWDIHMELPYGTMSDDEMRNLNVPVLQTNGLIFLWVTGRAMELGRECLELWGYKRVEELIWVKTNQLQRIIRTGRTGHWLNHSKEHCLVGIKGNPEVNRNIDTDVIVAEVRETSRKPDEMYPMLERISPRTRKLELFARMHNTHAGWISLGNQLSGVRLVDEGLRSRFKAAYPDVEFQPPDPPLVKHASESEMATPKSPPLPLGKDATAETIACEKATLEDKVVSPDAEAVV